ncbi:hypothetical protein PILCRDRAFT_817850 [Piloderma croceum F 1598]|uniref:Uncharacterized protein n=1 Tax=Piloderma croceum (strain F 1598) TaxID=765440 RepID=A0A0C3G2X9_PILCF|nr:hypothetical protein PILCRDRAFT_817850 [Piloderma croceum F 1598]
MGDKEYSSRNARNRHTARRHDEWQDLELKMIGAIPGEYRCPSGDFNASTIEDVFAHCISDACVHQSRYESMQDASIARISLFNPKEHRKSTDRRLNKAKRRQRVADVIIDSDMEGAGTEDGTSENDADSTAETMERFSQLSVDSIHAAACKASVPYDKTSQPHLEAMIEISGAYKAGTLKYGVPPGAWDKLRRYVSDDSDGVQEYENDD